MMFTPFPDEPEAAPVAGERQPDEDVPRVLLYSQDNIGLGHMRRTATVARALARLRPEAAMLLLTHAALPHIFELPPNLDVVRLPAIADAGRYPALKSVAGRLRRLRESVILDVALAFEPHLLYVDVLPTGVHGELVPTLRYLQRQRPARHTELVFVTRDLVDNPTRAVALWKRDATYELLEQVYDQIVIAGDQDVIDFAEAHGLGPAATAKVRYTGYVTDYPPPADPAVVRARYGATRRPFVVVTTGGGADGWKLLEAFVAATRLPALAEVVALVVTGPYLAPERLEQIRALRPDPERVVVVDFLPRLTDELHAADVVVTMGGYNTTCEVLSLGKRAVVVPRLVPQEQLARAERLAERGLVALLHPRQLTPAALAETITHRLAAPPPIVDLDFNGAERMARLLADALRG